MVSTENLYCRQVVDVLRGHGVKTAFCSPGSRNAPLLIALNAIKSIRKFVVIDERSAAFQALGYSLVKRKPVALVCTSGTAVLNYAPAIAEAYYAGVPLIVVSADRPREWIDQDDSQTIRQFGILGHIVKGSYDIRAIPEGMDSEYSCDVKWTVNRTVNEALIKAMDGKPGPVHINVQLANPLGNIADFDCAHERVVSFIRRSEFLPNSVIESLASQAATSKILVVAGFSSPDNALHTNLRQFASLPNVAVMTETISNLYNPQPLSTMIDSVLCRMDETEKQRMRPDIVISLGGALVSRMLKHYLRSYPPKLHWSLGHTNYFCDCFKSLTSVVDVSPDRFIRQLYVELRKSASGDVPDYSSQWDTLRRCALEWSERYIESAPWSDLKAFDFLLKNLTIDNLFLSNGTPVRYAQLIPHRCHAEYCNRGVSGIDGCTATAVGAARAYTGQTTLISGDISWLYDSGASSLHDIPPSMRIVVIDNSGGGIFRFINSTSHLPENILQPYFCVDNLPDIAAIASAYGLEVEEASDMEQLADAVDWLEQDSDLSRLLLVHTPPHTNSDVLKSYFSKI